MIEPAPSNPTEATSVLTTPRLNVRLLLAAALIASVLGAVIIGRIGKVFKMSPDFANMPLQPSPEYLARYNAALTEYQSRNYATQFAILGASLGAAIGWAGATRQPLRSLTISALGGAVAAGMGGFLLGLAAAYAVQVNRGEAISLLGVPIEPIVQTTALQCFVWALIGVGIGCGWTTVASGLKHILRGVEGGLIGGLLAGVVYSMCTAVFFSNSSGFTFIPEKPIEQILWALICGTSTSLGLIYAVAVRSSKESSARH